MRQGRIAIAVLSLLLLGGAACKEEAQQKDGSSAGQGIHEFVITSLPNYERKPNLSWGDDHYLITWISSHWEEDIVFNLDGRGVSSQGCTFDSEPFTIEEDLGDGTATMPSLDWDGTKFFIVWDEREGIFGRQITSEGRILGDGKIPISQRGDDPLLAWGDTLFLSIWLLYDRNNEKYDIYGTRIAWDGSVLDPSGVPIATGSGSKYATGIAWDGDHFFVVSGVDYGVYGTRVNPTGEILDPEGIPISTERMNQGGPRIAWNGEIFLVVWTDSRSAPDEDCEECHSERFRDIYGARVSAEGEVLDPEGIPICTVEKEQKFPSVAWNGEVFLVVWQDMRGEPESACPDPASDTCGDPKYADLYAARVTAEGEVLDPEGFPITTAPGEQTYPQIASDGRNFLVVWEDYRKAESDPERYDADIYGAIVGERGPCEGEESSGGSEDEGSEGASDESSVGGASGDTSGGEEGGASPSGEETSEETQEGRGAMSDGDRRGSSGGGGGCGFSPNLPHGAAWPIALLFVILLGLRTFREQLRRSR